MNGEIWVSLTDEETVTRLILDGVIDGTRDDLAGWLRILAERILDGETIVADTYTVR